MTPDHLARTLAYITARNDLPWGHNIRAQLLATPGTRVHITSSGHVIVAGRWVFDPRTVELYDDGVVLVATGVDDAAACLWQHVYDSP